MLGSFNAGLTDSIGFGENPLPDMIHTHRNPLTSTANEVTASKEVPLEFHFLEKFLKLQEAWLGHILIFMLIPVIRIQ